VWSFTTLRGDVFDIGSKSESFDSATSAAANGWEAYPDNNGDSVIDGTTFGFSNTNTAGGTAAGEIGGDYFGLEGNYTMHDFLNYYADTDLGLVLTDKDKISASGVLKMVFEDADDLASAFIGHFNTKRVGPRNVVDGSARPYQRYEHPGMGIHMRFGSGVGKTLIAFVIWDDAHSEDGTVWQSGLVGQVIYWDYTYDPETKILSVNFDWGTGQWHIPMDVGRYSITVNAFGAMCRSGDATTGYNSGVLRPGDDIFYDDVSYTGLTIDQARWPSPARNTAGVLPDVVLSWKPGIGAVSHDVYFGTSKASVAVGDRTWPQYRGNQTETTYDPPETLILGQTYYWRIDEVNGPATVKGAPFSFTVDTGVASNPVPADKAVATIDTLLSWKAGFQSVSHNVYFGTDETAVADATTTSPEFAGNQPGTVFDPGTLSAATRYYWRIDEVGATDVLPELVGPDGAIKGDVWTFVTGGYDLLKVDFGKPARGQPWPPDTILNLQTVKDGYIGWGDPRWWDLYMHDWAPYPDIGGTGVNAALSTAYDGEGGLKVYNMCMGGKAGDTEPSGPVVGDPIANSWFY
jgi:hypothetical protein